MTPARQPSDDGFTLLEMLVALTVLGMLMIGLTEGVRSGRQLLRAQSNRVVAIAEFDSTARLFRGVFTSIPVQPAALGAPLSLGFRGRADQVKLVGRLPGVFGVDRLVEMSIYRRAAALVFEWNDHHHEPGEPLPSTTEVLGGIAFLDFAYWGASVPEQPADWLAMWDGPALPELIRVRIGFPAGDQRRWPDLYVAPQL